MLAAGSITAPALVDLYLDRIARLDPGLRAYRIVLADSAREEAAAAQARLDAGERLGLLGVPIAIKADVDVAGEVTTYGSAAYGPAKTHDAEVVRKLRAAGAVIVGKTTVPEMMLWSFTETVAFGATRNPWNTDYAPGGSSGGSGAAVAAGLASMALGSDGLGSIRIPSTWCGAACARRWLRRRGRPRAATVTDCIEHQAAAPPRGTHRARAARGGAGSG